MPLSAAQRLAKERRELDVKRSRGISSLSPADVERLRADAERQRIERLERLRRAAENMVVNPPFAFTGSRPRRAQEL